MKFAVLCDPYWTDQVQNLKRGTKKGNLLCSLISLLRKGMGRERRPTRDEPAKNSSISEQGSSDASKSLKGAWRLGKLRSWLVEAPTAAAEGDTGVGSL